MFMIPLLGADFWLRVVVSRCGRLPSGNFANAQEKTRVKQKAPHRRGLHEIELGVQADAGFEPAASAYYYDFHVLSFALSVLHI
jgi:hypothetical protein